MVRPAQLTDFEAINHIRKHRVLSLDSLKDNEYRLRIQRDGFLAPEVLTFEEFKEELALYVVAEHAGEVGGYARIGNKPEMDPDQRVFWLQPGAEQQYLSMLHTGLSGLSVLPEFSRRGLATAMLRAAEQRGQTNGAPWLFSFVVTAPVTNLPSILFHEKHGFERVAVLAPCNLYGMESFQSFLYGKRIA